MNTDLDTQSPDLLRDFLIYPPVQYGSTKALPGLSGCQNWKISWLSPGPCQYNHRKNLYDVTSLKVYHANNVLVGSFIVLLQDTHVCQTVWNYIQRRIAPLKIIIFCWRYFVKMKIDIFCFVQLYLLSGTFNIWVKDIRQTGQEKKKNRITDLKRITPS